MKIFDTQGNTLLKLPEAPITLDGFATHSGNVGFELDGHRITVGRTDNFDEARALLADISAAYLGGASCFTVQGGDSP